MQFFLSFLLVSKKRTKIKLRKSGDSEKMQSKLTGACVCVCVLFDETRDDVGCLVRFGGLFSRVDQIKSSRWFRYFFFVGSAFRVTPLQFVCNCFNGARAVDVFRADDAKIRFVCYEIAPESQFCAVFLCVSFRLSCGIFYCFVCSLYSLLLLLHPEFATQICLNISRSLMDWQFVYYFFCFFVGMFGCSARKKNRVCVHTTIELDFGLFAVVVMGCYTHAGNSFSFVLCLVCCFATQFETHTQTIRYCFTGELKTNATDEKTLKNYNN